MAKETVLSSQNIYPGKLLKEGFKFDYPYLHEALKNLLT
jgi:NAD dependent epimerase/dehydratase family enzyme